MRSDLYDHPSLYDALLPVDAHVSFYAKLARRQAGAVLELACGTGQLTVPVALEGFTTVGLDRSRPMLEAAERRASASSAAVTFVEGDMRDFALGRQFNLVFVARNSLLHLHATGDLLAAFTAIRDHLAPDGVLAFDVFNPSVSLLARPAGERHAVMDVNTAHFGPLRVEAANDYDSASQVNRATWFISTADTTDAWVVPLFLRCIFPQELPLLLSAAGLELVSRDGGLASEAFDGRSRLQVCVCRRR